MLEAHRNPMRLFFFPNAAGLQAWAAQHTSDLTHLVFILDGWAFVAARLQLACIADNLAVT
jgi:hypothetical protein